MALSSESDPLFAALKKSAQPEVVQAVEDVVRNAPDRDLCRINALAFAKQHGLAEEATIAAFLHAARLGLFELAWNVLCPGCGGVLESSTSLKSVDQTEYVCALCAAGYEATLDEMVEVTFTVSQRVRRITAHDPHTLPMVEYMRQIFWGSGVDLPDDATLTALFDEIVLDNIEVAAGEKASMSLQLPAEFVIIMDP